MDAFARLVEERRIVQIGGAQGQDIMIETAPELVRRRFTGPQPRLA